VEASSTTTQSTTTSSEFASTPTVTKNPVALDLGSYCNDESDFAGHAELDEEFAADSATKFCSTHADDELVPDVDKVSENYKAKKGGNYFIHAEWMTGCQTQTNAQKISEPVGGFFGCADILGMSDCENGHVGGYTDAWLYEVNIHGRIGR
jgi:hypothetical protein